MVFTAGYKGHRWKSAAIVHGVYARYMAGNKSSDDVDLPESVFTERYLRNPPRRYLR